MPKQGKDVTAEGLLGGLFVHVDGVQKRNDGRCRIVCHPTTRPHERLTVIASPEMARELDLV